MIKMKKRIWKISLGSLLTLKRKTMKIMEAKMQDLMMKAKSSISLTMRQMKLTKMLRMKCSDKQERTKKWM